MIELSEFERHVLPEVIGCPSSVIEQAVVQSIIDFAEHTWIFTKSFNTTLTSSDIEDSINDYVDFDVSQYVTDKNVIAIKELRIDGLEWRLKYISLEDETSYMDYLREENQKVFSFPDTGTVRIHELESGEEVYLEVVYKPTYGITEIDNVIYYDWLDAIASGAKARLMLMPNQPWTNTKMASYYEVMFRGFMAQAKQKIQQNYTDEPNRVKWRRFGE